MTTIYQISDLHIKYTTDGTQSVHNNRDQLLFAIDQLLDHIGDTQSVIVITGDVFDRARNRLQTTSGVITTFHDIMNRLHPHTVVMIPGNHDMPEQGLEHDLIQSLIRDSVHDHVVYTPENESVRLSEVPVTFYVHNASVSLEDVEYDLDESRINMALLHEQPSDRIQIYAQRYDAAMLGDVHDYNPNLNGANWAYPGSLIQTRVGESIEKGFLKWTVSKSDVSYEFVPLKLHTALLKFSSIHVEKSLREIEGKFENIGHVSFGIRRADIRRQYATRLEELYDYRMEVSMFAGRLEEGQDVVEVREDRTLRDYVEENSDPAHRHHILEHLTDHWKAEDEFKQYILVELEWSNLYVYGEHNRVEFPRDGELIHLDAPNNSGKSSFLNIIQFALYGSVKRSTKSLIGRQGSKSYKTRIVVEIVSDGSRLIIERTEKSVSVDQVASDGTQLKSTITAAKPALDHIDKLIGDQRYFMLHFADQHRDCTKVDNIIKIPLISRLDEYRKLVMSDHRKSVSSTGSKIVEIPRPELEKSVVDSEISETIIQMSDLESRLVNYKDYNSETIRTYTETPHDELRLTELRTQLESIRDHRDHSISVDQDLLSLTSEITLDRAETVIRETSDAIKRLSREDVDNVRMLAELHPEIREHSQRPFTKVRVKARELPDLLGLRIQLLNRLNTDEYRELAKRAEYGSMRIPDGPEIEVDELEPVASGEEIRSEYKIRRDLERLDTLETLEDPTPEYSHMLEERSGEYQTRLQDSRRVTLRMNPGRSMRPESSYTPVTQREADQETELIQRLERIEELSDVDLDDLRASLDSIPVLSVNKSLIKLSDSSLDTLETSTRSFIDQVKDIAERLPEARGSVPEMNREQILTRLHEIRNPVLEPSIHAQLCSGCQTKFTPDVDRDLQDTLRHHYDEALREMQEYVDEKSRRLRIEVERKVRLLESEKSTRELLDRIWMTRWDNDISIRTREEAREYLRSFDERFKDVTRRKTEYDREMSERQTAKDQRSKWTDTLRRIEITRFVDRVLTDRGISARHSLRLHSDELRQVEDKISQISKFILSVVKYANALESRRIIRNRQQNAFDLRTRLLSEISDVESHRNSHEKYLICLENELIKSECSELRVRLENLTEIGEQWTEYDRYQTQLQESVKVRALEEFSELIARYTETIADRYKSDIEYAAQTFLDVAFPGTSIELEYELQYTAENCFKGSRFVIRFYKNGHETTFAQEGGGLKTVIETILRVCNIVIDDSRSKFICIDEGFGALDRERPAAFRNVFDQMKRDLNFTLVIDHTYDNVASISDLRWTIEKNSEGSMMRT